MGKEKINKENTRQQKSELLHLLLIALHRGPSAAQAARALAFMHRYWLCILSMRFPNWKYMYKLSLKVHKCIHAGTPLASIRFVLYCIFPTFYKAVLKILVPPQKKISPKVMSAKGLLALNERGKELMFWEWAFLQRDDTAPTLRSSFSAALNDSERDKAIYYFPVQLKHDSGEREVTSHLTSSQHTHLVTCEPFEDTCMRRATGMLIQARLNPTHFSPSF